ncbi:MAG: hypothetical protein KAS67_02955 [Thermoplasmata archaeon]|nr:hypothetical protein [Thermoplasmata archaeon]
MKRKSRIQHYIITLILEANSDRILRSTLINMCRNNAPNFDIEYKHKSIMKEIKYLIDDAGYIKCIQNKIPLADINKYPDKSIISSNGADDPVLSVTPEGEGFYKNASVKCKRIK